jgi:hypothetical protein
MCCCLCASSEAKEDSCAILCNIQRMDRAMNATPLIDSASGSKKSFEERSLFFEIDSLHTLLHGASFHAAID